MIRIRISAVVLALVALTSSLAAEESDYPLREAVECTPRSGLPNFRAKIEAGETIKIAYLGGSITAAAGWRVQSREWFQTSLNRRRASKAPSLSYS